MTTKRLIVQFNNTFYATSETFVYRQVVAICSTFQVALMGFRVANQEHFKGADLAFFKLSRDASWLERFLRLVVRLMTNGNAYSYYSRTFRSLTKYLTNREVLIHAHFGWNGIYILPFARKHSIPLVVSFHGNDASGARLKRASYAGRLPGLFEYASKIIVCSDHMISALKLERFLHKVIVVPYGVDTDFFRPRESGRKDGIVKILHSGRIVSKKGVGDLIRVFSKLFHSHPKVQLHLIGDGEEKAECVALASALGVAERIVFYGALPLSAVVEQMNDCDIFVLNSRTDEKGQMEGLPNSILEAMACGKPVVSTRHAGIPMAVKDGENGLLIDERNNDQLFDALNTLISNPKLRTTFGQRARVTILDRFTMEQMRTTLVGIFEPLVSG